MFKDEKVLGLIPARGGSKRLPKNNLLSLYGKPLIAWTIQAGQASTFIDSVIVSTEDQDIRRISLEYDIDEVIDRPAELATAESSSLDVLIHALNMLASKDQRFGYVAFLQPTSPLRFAKHIDAAFALMSEKGAQVVLGVCETENPTQWMGNLPSSMAMDDFNAKLDSDLNKSETGISYQINGDNNSLPMRPLYVYQGELHIQNICHSLNQEPMLFALPNGHLVSLCFRKGDLTV